jgi:nucleoside-diphosphate-sugar epimerase
VLALEQPEVSKGEAFHVVANAAVTFRGYADAVASWFGKDANLKFFPWNEFEKPWTKNLLRRPTITSLIARIVVTKKQNDCSALSHATRRLKQLRKQSIGTSLMA